jgi:hypothetical protein
MCHCCQLYERITISTFSCPIQLGANTANPLPLPLGKRFLETFLLGITYGNLGLPRLFLQNRQKRWLTARHPSHQE